MLIGGGRYLEMGQSYGEGRGLREGGKPHHTQRDVGAALILICSPAPQLQQNDERMLRGREGWRKEGIEGGRSEGGGMYT